MASEHHDAQQPERQQLADEVWAREIQKVDPSFKIRAPPPQEPDFLWIGCSDSRAPEWGVFGTKKGEVFVHRNIANQFPPSDTNALAVLEYALEHLYVKHVLVVGHTYCGGAEACLPTAPPLPSTPLGVWLTPLKVLGSTVPPGPGALRELIDKNVTRQVANVSMTKTVQKLWASGKDVWVHGWVYDIETGRVDVLGPPRGRPDGPLLQQ